MNLDDLLALLPDNEVGAIDAADLRTIVTALWNTGADVEARVGALETGSGSGDDTVAVTGRWQINATPGAVPGGQQVSFETEVWPSATWLRFTPSDQDNRDLTSALLNAQSIFMQQQDDSATWARWQVTGDATTGSGYVQVPVSFGEGQGSRVSAGWQSAIAVLRVPVTT